MAPDAPVLPSQVSLRDLRTFVVEHEFDAYSGSLSDFDVHGNLLVTCGFSSRMNSLACDRFLKVYDLRMMRATTPLQVHIDPFFLRFIPTYTSRLAIISQTGGRSCILRPAGLRSPGESWATVPASPRLGVKSQWDRVGRAPSTRVQPVQMAP